MRIVMFGLRKKHFLVQIGNEYFDLRWNPRLADHQERYYPFIPSAVFPENLPNARGEVREVDYKQEDLVDLRKGLLRFDPHLEFYSRQSVSLGTHRLRPLKPSDYIRGGLWILGGTASAVTAANLCVRLLVHLTL